MAFRLLARSLLCFAVLVVPAAELAAGDDDDRLLGASSNEYLWLAVRDIDSDGNRTISLRLHTLAMDGPYVSRLKTLPRLPVAMAAWENDLWLVFAPTDAAQQVRREVYRVEARRSPVMGGYFAEPRDRLELLPAMPGGGRLVGMAGTARGPVALIVPVSETAGEGARTDGGDAAPALDEPALVQLRGSRWEAIDPPTEVDLTRARHLVAAGDAGERLMIFLGPDGPQAGDLTLCLREPDGTWRIESLEGPEPPVREAARVGSQVVAAQADDEGVRLAVVRPARLLPLARVNRPEGRWTALGLRDGVRIVAQTGEGAPTTQRVSFPDGEVSDATRLERQPTDTMNWLRVIMILAVAVFGLALVVVLKPSAPATLKLPPNHVVASWSGRLGALAIDMLPGVVLTYLALDVPPLILLTNLPLVTPTFEDSVPYIVMACVTMAHSLPTEVISRRTLGKALLGLQVTATEEGNPTVMRLLIRNVMKWAIVLVPPLGVITLVNPNLQGLQDLLARTVVVRSSDEPPDAESSDR